jgi:ferredoxin
MTYIVSDACIRCKYTDCVAVCPVDCFREGANMLVIDPDECIDCGVCVPECPANAIFPDDEAPAAAWLEHNARYARQWPIITQQIAPPEDADNWKDRDGKMAQFDPAPAQRETA